MVQRLDPRVMRLGVQVGDEFRVYEGLYISAVGAKYADSNYGDAEIQIKNLRKDVRSQLLTETAPYNRHRVIKRVFLDVGRESTGVSRFFQGDIIQTSVSQPPDITVTIRALTGLFSATDTVSRSFTATTQLSQLSQSIARDLSVPLDFQATDKLVANYSYVGGALHQLKKLNEMGNISAFLDEGTLFVIDSDKSRANRTRVLSRDTGMIGIPEVLEHGVRVKMLFDNQTVVGGNIRIISDFYRAAEGTYTIYKLGFELANRAKPFYLIAEAVRSGGTI